MYEIKCDRGNGLETDGCWGGEENQFESFTDARLAAYLLAKSYPDCAWVLVTDNIELLRIPATNDSVK